MNERTHGGERFGKKIRYDFSVNVNPLGLPQAVQEVLRRGVAHWDRYPDPQCSELTAAIAGYHGIPSEWICCGNGAVELIWQLVRERMPGCAGVVEPTFSEYRSALKSVGCRVRTIALPEADGFAVPMEELMYATRGTDMMFLCNPNNPTGRLLRPDSLWQLADACRRANVTLVLDECFLPFLAEEKEYSAISLLGENPHLIVIRAFTKIYAMAGLRLGYALCSEAGLWDRVRKQNPPWSVSLPAQEAGVAALRQTEYLEQTKAFLRRERPHLAKGLSKLGMTVYPGEANFILFSMPGEPEPGWLYRRMLEEKILIRDCMNFAGLGAGYYRIAVRTEAENQYILDKMGGRIRNESVPSVSGG